MIERVHLLGIEEDAALAIALEGVVIPGIPQTKDDVRKLTRALVALGLWHVFVAAEVERRRMVSGCDEVPSGASVTDMIERRELAGERERLSNVVLAVQTSPIFSSPSPERRVG